MDNTLRKEMYRNLDSYCRIYELKSKYVVIFGSNQAAEEMLDYLTVKGIKVRALIDNNPKKIGTFVKDIKVDTPELLLGEFNENAAVLIASQYYYEMLSQLEAIGYRENVHVFKTVDMNKASANSITLGTFFKYTRKVFRGRAIYRKLLEQYGGLDNIFLCPVKALGDVYVAASYVNEYIDKMGIKDYVFLVPGKACAKTAGLLKLRNIIPAAEEDLDSLMQYYLLCGKKEVPVTVLYHRKPHTSRLGNIGNYKGISYSLLFKYGIYGLDEKSKPQLSGGASKSYTDKISDYVINFYIENSLDIGNTVILSPYAKAAAKLPDLFWIKVSEIFIKNGYSVCTNSSGDEEPPIPGTKAVFFDLEYSIEVAEAAGTIIALRSGFCDVISSARCRKFILYPCKIYGSGSFYEFFSLKQMELAQDVFEYEFHEGEEDTLSEEIWTEVNKER